MVNNFFSTLLQQADSRIAPTKQSTRYLLDKNEQSDDIDISLKEKVLQRLMDANWNRYPASDYKDIEAKIANYCGLQAENIVLSAGSASIITTLLDYFALNQKKIFITQPSYSLFDYHCKTYNIEYQPWLLTETLEFDYDHIPDLDANSVLIITSPNNPVGNTIDKNQLEFILNLYPDSLILLDGVYCEFSDHDFTPLVRQYENLVVLRSFSKAFPIAGLRLGYLCAAPKMAAIIKKLILQFSITHFSLIFAREILFDPAFLEASKKRVREIIRERDSLTLRLNQKFDPATLKVFKSEGNFLLIRIFDTPSFERVLQSFADSGIKVLNTSPFPLLQNTFRVSIGNPHENRAFFQCLRNTLAKNISWSHPVAEKLSNLNGVDFLSF